MDLESTPDFLAARERMNKALLTLDKDYTLANIDKAYDSAEELIAVIGKHDERIAYYMAWSIWLGTNLSGMRSIQHVARRFINTASKYGKIGT